MAEAETLVPEVKPRGFFEDKPTQLYSFARGLGLGSAPTTREILTEREQRGEKLAQRYEGAAEEGERELGELKKLGETQTAERAGKRPVAPALPPAPSMAARAFLQPGDSLLSQLQTAIMGIGQMAIQAKGLKGPGVGAMSALKGMAEGWTAGDGERVKTEYAKWKADSDRLLAQHRHAREEWEDLLLDQKQTWDQRMAAGRVRAEIAGNKILADQMRVGNIDAVLSAMQHSEALEIEHEKFAAQLAHWRDQAADKERAFQALEKRRDELARQADERLKLSERRTKLAEESNANVLKLQGEDVGLAQRLDNLARVRDAVALLDKEGLLPRGATFFDKGKAAVMLQSKPNRADIADAVQVVQRLGTPLLVGTEVSLGMTGSTLRLKSIGEAEAGNAAGIPKAFWDQFLVAAEKHMRGRRQMVREHLNVLGRTAGGAPAGDMGGWEVIE